MLHAERIAEGNHQAPVGAELFEQRRGNVVGSCGDDDGVERRLVGPSVVAVGHAGFDPFVTEAPQAIARRLAELRNDLHREHLCTHLCEHRSLISRARADLEHALAGLHFKQVGHHGDHEGLRDRLAVADRQWPVIVGAPQLIARHELVARHGAQGVDHARVELATLQLRARLGNVAANVLNHGVACADIGVGVARGVPAGRKHAGHRRKSADQRCAQDISRVSSRLLGHGRPMLLQTVSAGASGSGKLRRSSCAPV